MTRKGAIPIPYIIALILGVIVVVVLAYWFFTSGGRGGEVVSAAECRARIVAYCLEFPITKKGRDEDLMKVCGCSTMPIKDQTLFCNNFTTDKDNTGCVI